MKKTIITLLILIPFNTYANIPVFDINAQYTNISMDRQTTASEIFNVVNNAYPNIKEINIYKLTNDARAYYEGISINNNTCEGLQKSNKCHFTLTIVGKNQPEIFNLCPIVCDSSLSVCSKCNKGTIVEVVN